MTRETKLYPPIAASTALARLAEGGMLITVNGHLASDWKRRFAKQQAMQVFSSPAVFSWSAWLSELSRRIPDKVALTRLQEQLLWEQIITRDLEAHGNNSVASATGLARRAREAYALMREYQIANAELAMGGEESEALARWITAIRMGLKNRALDQRILNADLPDLLRTAMSDMPLSGCVILDGFESFSPMQQNILAALERNGCAVLQVEDKLTTAKPVLTACTDETGEFHHVADRVLTLVNGNPAARIAILTSDSSVKLPALRHALNTALIPETRSDPASDLQAVAMPGTPLSDMPMIRQLLHLLSAAGQPRISFDDFSALLFSPWLKGFEAERIERAGLDAAFREQNRHRLSWPALLKSSAVQKLPLLASVINVLAEWKTTSRPPNDWVKAVHGLLRTTGFIATGDGDEARRNNMEIRQMNAFRDVLSSLVASDAVMDRLSWARFLSMLRAGCSEHLLASTPKYPNVIVMPLAGMAGLRFDHVFVTGLDEEAFPPPVRPLPLLPPRLQQKHGLPMSSGSLAFDSSNWLWQQLLRAAPMVEISYARQRDGRELRPSSFVAGLGASIPIEASAAVAHPELESFDDAPVVPLQADEVIRGGTAIIKNQSACPFRAFAAHRLGISELGKTSPGIEPTTKGSLIHQALEFIWQRLATQQALLALDETERSALIDAAIAHAWKENRSSPDFDIQTLEKKRMRGVLNDWLNIEAARPNFEVLETEAEYGLPLPGKASRQITLNIKVDRLDKDTMGHRILIDYKTGKKQSSSKWLGERMEEPQLPLYAVAANVGGNDAVAMASVRSGDMGFEGLAAEDIGISGLVACDGKRGRPDDWRKVLDDWKLHINTLASEFVDGRCDVSPRDAHACRYCTLKALCRVEESGFDIEAGEDS